GTVSAISALLVAALAVLVLIPALWPAGPAAAPPAEIAFMAGLSLATAAPPTAPVSIIVLHVRSPVYPVPREAAPVRAAVQVSCRGPRCGRATAATPASSSRGSTGLPRCNWKPASKARRRYSGALC